LTVGAATRYREPVSQLEQPAIPDQRDGAGDAVVASPSTTNAEANPNASAEVARSAGRGGLAVAFAKIYFIVQGLVQQIALPRVLGLDGYGAWSTVNSIASVTYNPIVSMSIQGVSRAVADSPPAEQGAALRRALGVHAVFAVVMGLGFYFASPSIAAGAGAPHVSGAMALLSAALFLYALYAPLIGALNGQKRFLWQAGFDILAATLRTTGLVLGAWLFVKHGAARGIEGAAGGFVIGLFCLTLLAAFVVGLGKKGPSRLGVWDHVGFIVPVLMGQALLNVLLQADLTLLRRFAAEAAVERGLAITAADPLVGAYRATQLFSFLPYQLLISVNFILFPMLASAVRDADRAAVARYVATGVRIAMVVAGGMVSVTAGLSDRLIQLVFGAQAAALGGRSLELLALGFGAFAIFGVLTAVLNSLKQELSSMTVTAIAAAAVVALCFLRVRGAPFGEELLFRTATATSVGLVLATVGAAVLVRRSAGAVVRPLTALRVVVAVALTVVIGRYLPGTGKVLTAAAALALGLFYLLALIASGELGKADAALISNVISRRRGAR
jgi:stage V sporulation protein B